MDYIGDLYNGEIKIPVRVDLIVYETIQPPVMAHKAQFIMDVLQLAQTIGVYEIIPKSLSPFGKVALAFDLCKMAFDQEVQYIRSLKQWKSLYNNLQKLIYHVPGVQIYTEWNKSQCIKINNIDVVYYSEDISMWIHTIRQSIFDSDPIG